MVGLIIAEHAGTVMEGTVREGTIRCTKGVVTVAIGPKKQIIAKICQQKKAAFCTSFDAVLLLFPNVIIYLILSYLCLNLLWNKNE